MCEDEECEHADEELVSRRWSWMMFGAYVANFGGNIAKATWALCDDIKDAAKAHVAVDDDTREAYKSLHRDLESL